MFNLEIGFYLCDTTGFLRIMYLIKVALNLVRFAVPIILILMIVMDLYKNVINPKNKEGMKKITNRLTAAVIVFFVPTLVNLVVYLIDYVFESDSGDYKVTSCYTNGNTKCINNIDNYLNCEELGEDNTEAKRNCKTYRKCNSYKLSDNCRISTVEITGKCNINSEVGSRYKTNGYYNPSK